MRGGRDAGGRCRPGCGRAWSTVTSRGTSQGPPRPCAAGQAPEQSQQPSAAPWGPQGRGWGRWQPRACGGGVVPRCGALRTPAAPSQQRAPKERAKPWGAWGARPRAGGEPPRRGWGCGAALRGPLPLRWGRGRSGLAAAPSLPHSPGPAPRRSAAAWGPPLGGAGRGGAGRGRGREPGGAPTPTIPAGRRRRGAGSVPGPRGQPGSGRGGAEAGWGAPREPEGGCQRRAQIPCALRDGVPGGCRIPGTAPGFPEDAASQRGSLETLPRSAPAPCGTAWGSFSRLHLKMAVIPLSHPCTHHTEPFYFWDSAGLWAVSILSAAVGSCLDPKPPTRWGLKRKLKI